MDSSKTFFIVTSFSCLSKIINQTWLSLCIFFQITPYEIGIKNGFFSHFGVSGVSGQCCENLSISSFFCKLYIEVTSTIGVHA
jgi:hypothetical protein